MLTANTIRRIVCKGDNDGCSNEKRNIGWVGSLHS
jgi:hypothetical protein